MSKKTNKISYSSHSKPVTTAPIPTAEALFHRPSGTRPSKLTEAAIKRTEKQLGVKLPKAYLDLMRQQNGGRLRYNGFITKRRLPHGLSRGRMFSIREIAGIGERRSSTINSLVPNALGCDVPPLIIPLDGDGHWWFGFDYRKCGPSGQPCMTHYEPDAPTPSGKISVTIAPDFHTLVRGLVIDTNGQLVFAIDDAAMLDGGLASGLKQLGCRSLRGKGNWSWSRFQWAEPTPGNCRLSLDRNGGTDPWILSRPARHPLLCVSISAREQSACARALRDRFGSRIALIQSPPERRPVSGMVVEPAPTQSVRARRIHIDPDSVAPTDLNAAVLARDTAMIKRLLAIGVSPDKPCIHGGSSAIGIAAACGPASIFNLLWQHSRKRPTKTLLDRAARNGHGAIIQTLIDAGASPTTKHLLSAICRCHPKVVKLLLAHGAQPSDACLRHAAGVTTASEIGFPDKPQPAIMKLLRAQGLDARNPRVRQRFEAVK